MFQRQGLRLILPAVVIGTGGVGILAQVCGKHDQGGGGRHPPSRVGEAVAA